MELGMIQLLKMKQGVEKILHVPGNYRGGILEMALVVDCTLTKEEASENVKAIVRALKTHSEIFRNVRLNVLWWKSDEHIETEVIPLAVMQTERPFESYEQKKEEKCVDALLKHLKLFQARSKLIIVLGGGASAIADKEKCTESLKPFLGRKMLWILQEISPETEELSLKARMITVQV